MWGKLTAAVCERAVAEREGSGVDGAATGDDKRKQEEKDDAICDMILEVRRYEMGPGLIFQVIVYTFCTNFS